MYAISASDPPQLVEAKVEVDRLIGVWLGASGVSSRFSVPILNILLIVISCLVINKL